MVSFSSQFERKSRLEVLLSRVILNFIYFSVCKSRSHWFPTVFTSFNKLSISNRATKTHVVIRSSPHSVHFNVLSFFVWSQNVLVPVPCPRSPSPLVTGRDPVQAPPGQLEWRKQPANQEQLLLFFQEQSEDFLVQNKWVSQLLTRLPKALSIPIGKLGRVTAKH